MKENRSSRTYSSRKRKGYSTKKEKKVKRKEEFEPISVPEESSWYREYPEFAPPEREEHESEEEEFEEKRRKRDSNEEKERRKIVINVYPGLEKIDLKKNEVAYIPKMYLVVTGDTFEIKSVLKKLGFKWKPKLGWTKEIKSLKEIQDFVKALIENNVPLVPADENGYKIEVGDVFISICHSLDDQRRVYSSRNVLKNHLEDIIKRSARSRKGK